MVIWTVPAKEDLNTVYDYIVRDSLHYAGKVCEEIVIKSEMLDEFPELGRMVPELNNPAVREIIIYSYRIIYEIRDSNIEILTVLHGRRKFPEEQF